MVLRAGRSGTEIQFPVSYYPPSVTKSYIKGARLVTQVDGTAFSSTIRLPFTAYLVSVELDVDTHQYPNFYTLSVLDAVGNTVDVIADKVYDTGQKVLPLVIPYEILANYQLQLTVANVAMVKQSVAWHGNFIY